MNLAHIPLFAMLRGRLGYLTERQKVIAENVANADTAKLRAERPEALQLRRPGPDAAGPGGSAAVDGGDPGRPHDPPKNERGAGRAVTRP